MELFSLDGWLLSFLNSVWTGFSVLTPVCLILRLVRKDPLRQEAANIQYAANLVLAIAGALYAISWSAVTYEAWSSTQLDEEGGRNYINIYMFYEMAFLVAALLLFIPKLRRSWVMTLVALLSLHLGTVAGYIIQLFREYETSGWSNGDTGSYILGTLLFFVIVFVTWYLMARTNRLPYPSRLTKQNRH